MWINRAASKEIENLCSLFPVTAMLGPRQCGKSSLARHIIDQRGNAVMLDLESPTDLRKLDDPELFFEANRESMICLDEIQNAPDLFPIIRVEVDRMRKPGRFLILGSASPELLRQSSETLAGRIAFHELTPFQYREVGWDLENMRNLWSRGGFPDAYLAPTDVVSALWRKHFAATLLQRDLPSLGLRIDSNRLMKLLMLCAHTQGQLLNASKMAQILEVSAQTVRNQLELLTGTFLVRVLPPCAANVKKRLVKTPKIYFRDQGLLHQLLNVETFNELLGHPAQGASWEGFAIEQIASTLPDARLTFYRTSHGAEMDLLIENRNDRIAVEFKSSKAPKVSRGFHNAIADLAISNAWVVVPGDDIYPVSKHIQVAGLSRFLKHLQGE